MSMKGAVVYKYPFPVDDYVKIEMPRGALVLSVQVQDGAPTMWALVHPDSPKETRHFRVYGTGHEIDVNGLVYVGTFQLHEGRFVGHLFEDLQA